MIKMGFSKDVLVVTVFVLSPLLIATFVFPVNGATDVDILSHTDFMDSYGSYHIVGEVINVGDQPARFVKVVATFYDSSNVVIATDFTYTELDVILVGRKSPFDILFTDEGQIPKIHHYSLSITFSYSASRLIGLQILSNSSYTDHYGSMHIVGDIKNIGESTTTFVKVIATFYDSTGNVMDCDFTFSELDELVPNQISPFEILYTRDERIPFIETYVLTAESSQYAIVPELSSMLIAMLFMIGTVLAVVACKKNSACVGSRLAKYQKSD